VSRLVSLVFGGRNLAAVHSISEGGVLMSGSADNRIVQLATASNPQEAALWQQALEAEGIRCRVVGEALGSFGVVYPGSVQREIWVFESDVDRARTVLQSSRKGEESAQ
jgi:hypothetical protein